MDDIRICLEAVASILICFDNMKAPQTYWLSQWFSDFWAVIREFV